MQLALEQEGVCHAIQRPLAPDSRANRLALARILPSVPDSIQPYLGEDRLVAYKVMQSLETKFTRLDYHRLADIEVDLKSATLSRFDGPSVEEHIALFERRLQQMMDGGAAVPASKALKWLAETLPKDSRWNTLVDSLVFATPTLEEGKRKLREKCRMIRDIEPGTGPNRTSRKEKSSKLDPTEKEALRQRDRELGRRFYCHGQDKDGRELPPSYCQQLPCTPA